MAARPIGKYDWQPDAWVRWRQVNIFFSTFQYRPLGVTENEAEYGRRNSDGIILDNSGMVPPLYKHDCKTTITDIY